LTPSVLISAHVFTHDHHKKERKKTSNTRKEKKKGKLMHLKEEEKNINWIKQNNIQKY